MVKKLVHFAAIFVAGIIAGGQYVVSFDYETTGMSASFYTEKMQYAIHHIGTPLFGMLITAPRPFYTETTDERFTFWQAQRSAFSQVD
ncbi:MAG: hypothetical protein ACR2IH_02380 [Pyrinomonadaceae bacterium]